ncbi:MAG: hypothetical protein A2426_02720 [Candidatus Lambdaproteobacteria bacterium RIFOXYC1_FULL_56_13]|nr:MAG: hypothetical protein A2426_02720 [Candidatus Lambdaproteobacteria bacterium RIFOXYC1_FULL_56_13]
MILPSHIQRTLVEMEPASPLSLADLLALLQAQLAAPDGSKLPLDQQISLSQALWPAMEALEQARAEQGDKAFALGQNLAQERTSFFNAPQPQTPEVLAQTLADRLANWGSLPVLASLSPWDSHLLLGLAQELELAPGQPFLEEGKPVTGLYLVSVPVEVCYQGIPLPLAMTGGLFGQEAVFSAQFVAPLSYKVGAAATALYIPQERLREALSWNPGLELWLLAQRFFRSTQTLNRLAQEYQKVNRESRLTQEILDNTGQASFSIDAKGEIGTNYSTAAAQYLGEPNPTGLPFADLILRDDKKALRSYYRALNLIFAGNQFDPKVVLDLLPKQVHLQDRVFALHYYFAEDKLGFVTSVYVRMKDLTEEINQAKLAQETKDKEREEKEIEEKIRSNIASFLGLLEMIDKNQANLERFFLETVNQKYQANPQDLRGLLKELHSIKGLCSQFGLQGLKHASHATESALLALGQGKIEQFAPAYKELKSHYKHAHILLESLGEGIVSVLMGVTFTKPDFLALKQAVFAQDWPTAQALVSAKGQIPASSLAENWEDDLLNLGMSLGKEVDFELVCPEDLTLPLEMVRTLNFELRHVYRNAIDHGLETPEVRKAAGKRSAGKVRLTLGSENGQLSIAVEDDGAGIAWERILQKARSNPNLDQTQIEAWVAQNQAWRILFLPGFSSQEQLTELSGRGVGMDAVASAIEGLGGSYSLESTLGAGSKFKFLVPLS